MDKPILTIEFEDVVSDQYRKPIKGALEFILENTDIFSIHIYSNRIFSTFHIKNWLKENYFNMCKDYDTCNEILKKRIEEIAFADPWEVDAEYVIDKLVDNELKFPLLRPNSLFISSKAIPFKQEFPNRTDLLKSLDLQTILQLATNKANENKG